MRLLETTLRDGSYVIDFQFTVSDTVEIAKALESFGFEFIEIGHGLGLNAQNCGKGRMPSPDEDYLKAISKALKKAKWGMFFIPGIGRYEDIDIASYYGMSFIRVGTNIVESEKGLEYIEYAKRRGMFVSANLMKSYAVSEEEFAKRAQMAFEAGADVVYLVDSAGGMLPEDVEKYLRKACEIKGDKKLGFHGHDNLKLAVANSLKAIECGAEMIDVSLQGLGRGGGNTPTEILVAILLRKGLVKDIDLYALMDFSESVVKPMLQDKGIDSITIVSGFSFFHSSYFPVVKKYAQRYGIDPRELITELCKIDVVRAPESLLEEIAKKLRREKRVNFPYKRFCKRLYEIDRGNIKVSLKEEVQTVVKEIVALSKKLNKMSVLNIVIPFINENRSIVSRFINEGSLFVIGSCEVDNIEDLGMVLQEVDGKVDIIFYDAEIKINGAREMLKFIRNRVKSSLLLIYRDTDVWAKAIESLVVELTNSCDKKVLVIGENPISFKVMIGLTDIGYEVFTLGREIDGIICDAAFPIMKFKNGEKVDIIIGLDPFRETLTESHLAILKSDGIIIDGGIGNVSKETLEKAFSEGIKVIRVDMRGALEAEINGRLNAHNLVVNALGEIKIRGKRCVAGGVYGREGDIVLDSVKNPKVVIGIADGKGKVKYILNEEEKKLVREIEEAIFVYKDLGEDV